jgi:hypothetical protein
MTSDLDRKAYWDLMETVCWICTRDEQHVAALRDVSDQEKMALVLWKMRGAPRIIHSPPGPLGLNLGAELGAFALQGDWAASHPLNDVLAKVQSGCVRMTAIRCDGSSDARIPLPLAETNDLRFLLMPSHSVAPMGVWSRTGWTLLWRSPQFLRADAVRAWPARNTKTAAVSAAILRHLREIMSAEAPLTKLEAQRRCMAEVPNAYPEGFKKAWAELDPSCKRRRDKHGPRVR